MTVADLIEALECTELGQLQVYVHDSELGHQEVLSVAVEGFNYHGPSIVVLSRHEAP